MEPIAYDPERRRAYLMNVDEVIESIVMDNAKQGMKVYLKVKILEEKGEFSFEADDTDREPLSEDRIVSIEQLKAIASAYKGVHCIRVLPDMTKNQLLGVVGFTILAIDLFRENKA